MLGPADPTRSVAAEALLPAAAAAAREAGVTRLADITRLDRIGLPVWQAVRPASRALSVHQGKGATQADAKLGALLEAVESDAAERFDADGPICAFRDLPERERAPAIDDFASERGSPPPSSVPIRWVEADNLNEGGKIYLPFPLVSLDLTRDVPSRFDRASNGVATGATREEAAAAALFELIERDAVTEWKSQGMIACMESMIDPDSVGLDWFALWRERIAAAGAHLRCYYVPSVTGTPVFGCEINDGNKDGRAYRAMRGLGCHPLPEIALFRALAEAIQGRATYIAGAREDLIARDYEPDPPGTMLVAFGLPPPPSMEIVDFRRVAPTESGLEAVVAALETAGYGPIALIDLARPPGLAVARAFVCGLGSLVRRRRRTSP